METEISTHALTEGDRKDMFCSSVCMNFNSRPHGGRQHEDSLCDRKIRHFNSRPHGGRRMTPLAVPLDKCISTHALTEGDRRL